MKPSILIRSKKNKATELLNNNQLREADALFMSVCQSAPADVESWVMRAIIHRKLGLFKESEAYCRRALTLNTGFSWAHQVLGSALQCQGRMLEAIASYQRAIQLKPDLVEAHYFLANALREMGAMIEAAASYRRAIELNSNFVEALSNLGAVLTHLDETEEATKVLNKANSLRPNTPQILCNQGNILQREGRLGEALEKYQRALCQNPDFLDAISNVATLLEKTNQFEEAQLLIDRELSRAPDNPALLLAAAKLARRARRISDAINLLETAAEQKLDLVTAGEIHLLLGQLYDHQGDTEQAYSHLVEGNELVGRTMKNAEEDRDQYFERIAKMRSWLTPELANAAGGDLDISSDLAPVFLLGFPRSGTTLLEQILDSHPALQTLEEKGAVSALVRAFENMAQGCQNALAELTQIQILQLRTIYFDEVARHIRLQPGRQLVDKMPLNMIDAHIIWRVFPRAKFILAVRHPCDVCFSCFMQNINLNSTASFCTLEDTALIYAEVMGLWQAYIHSLPLNYRRIRYEDLVDDLERETHALLDFLEVGWDGSVLDHTDHALKRGTISTPSYHQVTQPIYHHAKYRWRRYAKKFESIMPTLQPFIDYFNYCE